MDFIFFKGAVWQLVRQMDWIAIIILIALLCISVLCIAIIAFKYTALKRSEHHLAMFAKKLRSAKTMSDLSHACKEFPDGIGATFLMQNMNTIGTMLADEARINKTSITTLEFEIIEETIGQGLDEAVLREEMYLPFLGTNAAVAPLIGLFGTIWGLIHAFIDISQEKSADIATVAPGMAEALIVTLAGLIVAIPAMIAFHYFSNKIRHIDTQMTSIATTFLTVVKRTFVK